MQISGHNFFFSEMEMTSLNYSEIVRVLNKTAPPCDEQITSELVMFVGQLPLDILGGGDADVLVRLIL